MSALYEQTCAARDELRLTRLPVVRVREFRSDAEPDHMHQLLRASAKCRNIHTTEALQEVPEPKQHVPESEQYPQGNVGLPASRCTVPVARQHSAPAQEGPVACSQKMLRLVAASGAQLVPPHKGAYAHRF